MIDIEQTILNITGESGGHELAITQTEQGIVARTTAIHARYLHKQGTGVTLSIALIEVAGKLGVEAPIKLHEEVS